MRGLEGKAHPICFERNAQTKLQHRNTHQPKKSPRIFLGKNSLRTLE
jgi:hypothetical protein